ncbi:MAG: hypothetical protein JRE40_02365 [Deltaproteobacteria bacterium]|nr:hypothetical protein [Deltaproteobacteria bacterium]
MLNKLYRIKRVESAVYHNKSVHLKYPCEIMPYGESKFQILEEVDLSGLEVAAACMRCIASVDRPFVENNGIERAMDGIIGKADEALAALEALLGGKEKNDDNRKR